MKKSDESSADEANHESDALTQYRDLPHNAVLAVGVWGLAEARPLAPLGGATMRLFSKKARLPAVSLMGLMILSIACADDIGLFHLLLLLRRLQRCRIGCLRVS